MFFVFDVDNYPYKFFTISDERKRSFYEKDSKIFGAFVFL